MFMMMKMTTMMMMYNKIILRDLKQPAVPCFRHSRQSLGRERNTGTPKCLAEILITRANLSSDKELTPKRPKQHLIAQGYGRPQSGMRTF
jgi:hypothetical protein